MRRLILLILASAALAACSGGRDVHGSKRVLRVDEAGNESFQDIDLSMVNYRTYVDKGGGEYEVSPGTSYTVGVFIVQDVTEDDYLLLETNGEQTRLFVSDSDDIDLSFVRPGRDFLNYPEDPALLQLDLSNVDGLGGNDRLEVLAPNIDLNLGLSQSATTAPAAGDDHVRLIYNFEALALPLLTSELGDRVLVSKIEPQGGLIDQWTSVTRLLEVPPVSVVEGQTAKAAAAFVEVPQDQTWSADIRSADFAGMVGQIHPRARFVGGVLNIGALHGAKKHGLHAQPASILEYYTRVTDENYALDLTYSDPFPVVWDDVASAEFVYLVAVAGDGATSTATITLSNGYVTTLEDMKSKPIAPRITPVKNVKIQGNDARQNLAGVSTEPFISWDPPDTGNPQSYRLNVHRFGRAEDGSTALDVLVEIYTEDTFFQFPTGTVPTGVFYAIEIIAYDEASRDIDRVPFRRQLPASFSSMLTGTFIP